MHDHQCRAIDAWGHPRHNSIKPMMRYLRFFAMNGFLSLPTDYASGHSQRLEAVRVERLSACHFLETNMKTILLAVLVLGLCGLAVAQGEKADPVGTWKCEYQIGGQKRTSTLTIKMDGEKLAGTMSWPDQKETNLKDLKLKDGDLTFSAIREVGGNKYDVEYKFTITGDKLKGQGAVLTGGEKRPFDIEGKREKKDKSG